MPIGLSGSCYANLNNNGKSSYNQNDQTFSKKCVKMLKEGVGDFIVGPFTIVSHYQNFKTLFYSINYVSTEVVLLSFR